MTTRLIKITSLSLMLWLFMATTTLAQSENEQVLDTTSQPLESGKEYYIRSYLLDIGGRVTLINRNDSCPLYVGQEFTDLGKGLPVIFTPFAKEDKFVKVNRDFKVKFSASSTCGQSTEWKLGDRDIRSGRRLIIAGSDGSYFRIVQGIFPRTYNIRFCPTDTCGTVGTLRENLTKILLALDGSPLAVEFERA